MHLEEGDAAIRKILKRAILILQVDELLARGNSFEDLVQAAQDISPHWYTPYERSAFRFDVDDYMAKVPGSQQVTLINRFSFMPLKGPVSMASPDVCFCIHLDATDASIDGTRAYLGRVIGEGERGALMGRFNLKRRPYLGTTSMDAELSLVMANVAAIRPGSLVYDPFVGTGSLLCTAAAFGGLVLGSDIDGRQMRGTVGVDNRKGIVTYGTSVADEGTLVDEEKGVIRERGKNCTDPGPESLERPNRSLVGNLRTYGLDGHLLDALVFDIRQHPWRADALPSMRSMQFDTILTDPPYGVRAGAKKIGTRNPYPISSSAGLTAEEKALRYPKTVAYEMEELAEDLHKFAAHFLRPGGRLVYWYPAEFIAEGTKVDGESKKRSLMEAEVRAILPIVSELKLLSLSRQPCRLFDRWLLVYEKQ